MAGRSTDWDQLLLRSEDLVQKEVDFPRVERDITQIENLSQRLRSQAARADRTTEVLDASRLLAQEGLNPRKLTQSLQNFELRPTYEDVFPTEAANMSEYLQQVHERIAASAIRDVQQSTVAAFDNYMDNYMETAWAAKRQTLLDSVMPFSAATASGRAVPGMQSPYGAAPAYAVPAGTLQLRGRAAKYAQVVKQINASLAAGQQYDPITDFAAACADDVSREKRSTMLRVWQVAQRQLDAASSVSPSARSQREAALITGSRKYLEANFVAYMENVVHSHRSQAALGGVPSRTNLVHAFLRVKERDRGVLDFDQTGGVDTSWLRVYVCLRAGFLEEAVQAAKGAKDIAAVRPGGVDLARCIQEWADGGYKPLSGDLGNLVTSECERLLRDKSLRGKHPYHAHRVMVHALLAGSNRTSDAVIKEYHSFFTTIEDFLWFKLGLIRASGRAGIVTGSVVDSYGLHDLQQYLQQYPATHYSHGGREPLLYVVVLMLSLQYGAALAFLAKDASTVDNRLDAVHLGIALWDAGILDMFSDTPTAQAAVNPPPVEGTPAGVGSLVHRYGREFLHADPQLALEYYMMAASVMGGAANVRGALLRELLAETRAYGMMLGSGGAEGGALAAFVPDVNERRRVLEAVAAECAAQAQLEEATELYMVAGRPRQALHILNQRLSNVAEAAARDVSRSEEADTLEARGNASVAAMGPAASPDDLKEIEAFESLKTIRALLAASARGDRTRVLHHLNELSFIPTDRSRLQLCTQGAVGLHGAVADLLQPVLLASAEALAAGGKKNELETLIAYAAGIPNRATQTTYKKLNQLQANMAG